MDKFLEYSVLLLPLLVIVFGLIYQRVSAVRRERRSELNRRAYFRSQKRR